MIWIVDIDGTVADISHRLHFIKPALDSANLKVGDDWHTTTEKFKPDWDAFNSACTLDAPIKDVIALIRYLAKKDIIYMMTGRTEDICMKTRDWLTAYNVPCDTLIMRKSGDYRPDTIVKSEMLDKVLTHFAISQIAGVFEDRAAVVAMFRARGLRVYHVAAGEY